MSSATNAAPSRAPARRSYPIRRRAQIEALVSAVRQEIIDTLVAAGPRSAAELARLTGRPADALYYHLRRLVAVGLVAPQGERRRGRRPEVVYDVVGFPLRLDYPRGRDARTDPTVRLVAAMLRTAERDFRRGLASRRAVVDGPARTLWATRRHAWLSPADIRRVNRVLTELLERLGRSRRPDRGELCTLTFVLAPRAARTGRRGRARRKG